MFCVDFGITHTIFKYEQRKKPNKFSSSGFIS